MYEALRVEDELSVHGHTSVRYVEKRKWEGPSDHSKEKNNPTVKKTDKPNFCGTC